MSLKTISDAKDIGMRFRSARSLVPLNRKDFCEKHDINRYTMQSWENGLHVSKGKNVAKFCLALAKEGVICNINWLIDGLGAPPKKVNFDTAKALSEEGFNHHFHTQARDPKADPLCQKLLQAYRDRGGDQVLLFEVLDSLMEPEFSVGDLVIAKKVTPEKVSLLNQAACLIELGLNQYILRRINAHGDQLLLLANRALEPIVTLSKEHSVFEIVWRKIGRADHP